MTELNIALNKCEKNVSAENNVNPKIKIKKPPVTRQSKCCTCEKNINCYGTRYCQQNFNPASFLENKIKK
ncbi:MAG TPA: hypothetical protein ENI15_13025 [Spirochaetes bacterium]|nr:hypothetical protein [Spirochaetota bacterium]